LFRLSHASLAKFCSVVWRWNTPFQYFSLTWSDIFNRTSFDNFYIRGILVFVPTTRSLLSCSFGHRRYSLPLLCFLLYAYTTFWVIVIKRRKDRGKKHNFLRKKKELNVNNFNTFKRFESFLIYSGFRIRRGSMTLKFDILLPKLPSSLHVSQATSSPIPTFYTNLPFFSYQTITTYRPQRTVCTLCDT